MVTQSDYLEQLTPENAAVLFIDNQTSLTMGVQSIDNTYILAGLEVMITELGEPAPERALPPKGRPMQPSPTELASSKAAEGNGSIFLTHCVNHLIPACR